MTRRNGDFRDSDRQINKMSRRIILRDSKGRFLPASERYKGKVKTVQVKRRDKYVTVVEQGKVTPETLAEVTTREEFESLSEALGRRFHFETKRKYRAWHISEQIDKTKGLRRKLLKITLNLRDGKRLRPVAFYHEITANQKRSYQLFQRINNAVGMEGAYLYDRIGGKIIADRKGKKMTLESVDVQEVL